MRGPDFHAGGKAGSWIPYVIPNSVRHPMRDHLRATCFIRCGTPPYLGSEVNGGPLGGVPPSLDIPAPRSAFFIENFCVWRNCLDPPYPEFRTPGKNRNNNCILPRGLCFSFTPMGDDTPKTTSHPVVFSWGLLIRQFILCFVYVVRPFT